MQEDLDVLRAAQAKVRALLADGMSEEDIVSAVPLAEFESRNWSFITTERMTRTLVQDLQARP